MYQVNLQDVIDGFSLCSYIVILVGIPAALYNWVRNRKLQAYQALDDKFWNWSILMTEHPDYFQKRHLLSEKRATTEQEKTCEYRRYALCSMLSSIFELAFFNRNGFLGKKILARQWDEWRRYMNNYFLWDKDEDDFCKDFQEFWRQEIAAGEKKGTYEIEFVNYIKKTYPLLARRNS